MPIELRGVWLNAAADPSEVRAFEYLGDGLAITPSLRGEVRQNVNRRRLIRGSSRVYETISASLESCSATDVQWLNEHVGELVCIRDHVGSKAYVVYLEAPREIATTKRLGQYYATVKVTFEEVDHTEAV